MTGTASTTAPSLSSLASDILIALVSFLLGTVFGPPIRAWWEKLNKREDAARLFRQVLEDVPLSGIASQLDLRRNNLKTIGLGTLRSIIEKLQESLAAFEDVRPHLFELRDDNLERDIAKAYENLQRLHEDLFRLASPFYRENYRGDRLLDSFSPVHINMVKESVEGHYCHVRDTLVARLKVHEQTLSQRAKQRLRRIPSMFRGTDLEL